LVPPGRNRSAPVKFDFSIGIPDLSAFPFGLWRSLLASSGRVLGAAQGHYGNSQGDLRLREAISQYVAFTRAVVCRPDEIIITRGAQQTVDLLARVLLTRGDTAVVEEPGYPPVRDLLILNGIQVASVDVDSEGILVGDLPAKARVVYVTPSHQFPLGMPMSLDRKLTLLRWAAKRQACIIEDDYDSEYRFEPRPLESLQSLDRHGVVAYVGTFSKIMQPGLRIGFIVAPRGLVSALTEARRLNDSNESALLQHALARFISEGHLARHIRRMSKVYGRRRVKLIEMLTRFSSVFGNVVPSVAGLHVACLQETAKQASDLVRRGEQASARFTPLSRFSTRPARPGVVFGYGAIPEDSITEGIKAILDPKKGKI
jgi:GntR family transcriptional regulator/MocR family aminotransferase